jgi:hypothetical protein
MLDNLTVRKNLELQTKGVPPRLMGSLVHKNIKQMNLFDLKRMPRLEQADVMRAEQDACCWKAAYQKHPLFFYLFQAGNNRTKTPFVFWKLNRRLSFSLESSSKHCRSN